MIKRGVGKETYEGSELLLHSVSNTGEHSCTSREHNVSVQVLADINVALHDGVVGGLVNTSGLHTQEGWLEEGFRATETFVTDGDNLSIGQLVALLKGRGGGSGLHLLLEVEGDVGELLLDVLDSIKGTFQKKEKGGRKSNGKREIQSGTSDWGKRDQENRW